jgi:hypothetical protein
MRGRRTRAALLGVLALAAGATMGAGPAQAAKVTKSAPGGLLPDTQTFGIADVQTPFVQQFKLKGKDVKGKQILDVNVISNSTSPDPSGSLFQMILVSPKGGEAGLPFLPGSNRVNVEFDDQSDLFPCNPMEFQARDCNYLQGGNPQGTTGTMTGKVGAELNPQFKGGNPKGTWTIYAYDIFSGPPSITLGTTKLEVKTGKKFAKE